MLRSLSRNKMLTTVIAVGIIVLAALGIVRTTAAAFQQNAIQAEAAGINIDGCNGNCAACGLCTVGALPVIDEMPD